MARRPGNADRRLIAAAKEIVIVQGCSGLRVRDIARRAGVNLGMFHYHFQNKKRFTRILLTEFYEGFFKKFSIASREGPDAFTQLRNALLAMAKFIRAERHLVAAILKDVLNGDPEVTRFVRANLPRHAGVIHELLFKCQREGSLKEMPVTHAMAFVLTAVNAPTLIGGVIEKVGPADFRELALFVSDDAILQRVDLAMKGLKS